MQAAILKGFALSTYLSIEDLEIPKIESDEVLVQVKATSINPVDWQTRSIVSFVPEKLRVKPLILGHDFSGLVVKTGSGVTHFKVGDAVFGTNGLSIDACFQRKVKTGTYAELTAVKVSKIAHKPKSINFNQAAALPLVSLTALQGLKKAQDLPGKHILVIGGSGGVGSMVVQIAKARDAIVTAVCSTKNIDFVKSLGADKIIDYCKEDYLNKQAAYDVVFNTIGHQSVSSCSNLLKTHGVFIDCAAPSFTGAVGLTRRYLSFSTLKNRFFLYQASSTDLREIAELVDAGKLMPEVGKLLTLKDIEEGHRLSKAGRTVGKLVVSLPNSPQRNNGLR